MSASDEWIGFEKQSIEVQFALFTQCRLLSIAINQYDQGNHFTCLWMANGINTICHDKGGSHISILRALGIKDEIFVISSVDKSLDKENLLPQSLLTNIRIHSENHQMAVKHVPKDVKSVQNGAEKSEYRKLSVNDWLNEPVLLNSSRQEFSRIQIVSWMRNTVGGAHFDKSPKHKNFFLHRGTSNPGSFCSPDGFQIAPDNTAEDAAVRQMVHELLASMVMQSKVTGLNYEN